MVSVVPISQEHRHRTARNLVSLGHTSCIQGRLGFGCPRPQICIFLRKLKGLCLQTECAALCRQPVCPLGLSLHTYMPLVLRGPRDTWLSPEPATLPRTRQECPSRPEFLG